MEKDHTRGPWEVIPKAKGFPAVTITGPAPDSTTEARYMPIATVHTYKNKTYPCFYEVTDEERDANARLMAAAPDLLHALRSLVVAVTNKDPEQFPGHHKAYLDQVALPQAIKALAKATAFDKRKVEYA